MSSGWGKRQWSTTLTFHWNKYKLLCANVSIFRQIQQGIHFVMPTLVYGHWPGVCDCLSAKSAVSLLCETICYNVCYMWTLLQCVLYVDFATLCVIHGLWTSICLNTWIQYVKFEHQSFENSVWLSVLSELIKGAVFGRIKELCFLGFPIDAQCIFKAQHLKFRKPLI